MAKSAVKQLNKRTLLYNSGQTPPFKILFASALQHMIILLSMGMAVPVTIAKAAGLEEPFAINDQDWILGLA